MSNGRMIIDYCQGTEEDCGDVICGYHIICLEGLRKATKVTILPLFIQK